jgi:hypothetical protein
MSLMFNWTVIFRIFQCHHLEFVMLVTIFCEIFKVRLVFVYFYWLWKCFVLHIDLINRFLSAFYSTSCFFDAQILKELIVLCMKIILKYISFLIPMRLKGRIQIINFWERLIHRGIKMRFHFFHLIWTFNIIKLINLFKHLSLIFFFLCKIHAIVLFPLKLEKTSSGAITLWSLNLVPHIIYQTCFYRFGAGAQTFFILWMN